jgi:hypothetical protein
MAIRTTCPSIVVCLSILACGDPPEFVTPEGYLGVRIGMSVGEASQASGLNLTAGLTLKGDEVGCFYVSPNGVPGPFIFMVLDGRIARVDVRSEGILTNRRVGVGSSEREVSNAYPGQVKTTIHPYTGPTGHYLTIEHGNGIATIFETDGNIVESYRVGSDPAVRWIEGCS